MHPARIAELLKPFLETPILATCHSDRGVEEPAVLSPAQLQHISTYIDILLRWNARINLTAVRAPEQIVTRHFGESLFAARCLFPERPTKTLSFRPQPERTRRQVEEPVFDGPHGLAETGPENNRGRAALQGRVSDHKQEGASAPVTLADLGSGAGFPGLPIKLWVPEIHVTLIEANAKKVAFLRETARALTLTDVNILHARSEPLLNDPASPRFNVVTLRAVEHFSDVLPVAAGLLAPYGRLALLIGSSQVDQAHSILPHFSWNAPLPIPLSSARCLMVGHAPTLSENQSS